MTEEERFEVLLGDLYYNLQLIQESTVPNKKDPVRTTEGGPVLHKAEKETQKERITIKSGSEAKRAFIYSEIFNRKY